MWSSWKKSTEAAFRPIHSAINGWGWKNFSAVATFENGEEHAGTQTTEPYLYGFLQNLYLRPSCHSCSQLRGECHAADITLADLWGAEKICPERDDDTGLSFVMANTQKGRQALEQSGMQLNARFQSGISRE
ncbi:MAG: Coenzyme F420 hydrogenase/dehydrogenase, beta subunit C-terminal domain [Christensenellales bacterium]